MTLKTDMIGMPGLHVAQSVPARARIKTKDATEQG
ncbi:hypothetical protein MCEMSEM23_01464 [Rhabdaerophilaceae bacterium]